MGRKLRVKLITIPWELEVPTLALASLAAVTPEEYFEVCIVDVLRERLIIEEPTDLVGISASTPSINIAYALADVYRDLGVKVVLGGHHVSAMPDEGLEHADAVVCGEGETSWRRILDQMLSNPSLVSGKYKDEVPDLTTLPQPRIDLMKIHRYSRFYYPVVASRGCPEFCSFCFAKKMTKGYRTYPISHVIEQVRSRPSWVKSIFFVDDNIAGDIEYTRELFKQLKKYQITFGIQARHEFSQDPYNLRLAKEAGCMVISSGYESINQDSLDKTAKRASASLYKEIISNIQKEGMVASGNWMFGFDWDTPSVFQETLEFLKESKILHSSFTTEIPFPGTASFRRYQKEGRILTHDYDQYVGKDRVVIHPKMMSPTELQDGIRWLSTQYYSIKHRHQLAVYTANNPAFFPFFKGVFRKPAISFLNYSQVYLWRYRMVPSLRWLYFSLVKYNKYRHVSDLFRGTNFWHKSHRASESNLFPFEETNTPFLDIGGYKKSRKSALIPENLTSESLSNLKTEAVSDVAIGCTAKLKPD